MNRAMKTIWIVDDDEDERLLIEDAFIPITAEIKLIWLEDGEAMLSRLRNLKLFEDKTRSHLPDLILLDLNMPAMSGLDVLKTIKADKDLPPVCIIIYSTSSDERDIRESYENGANAYIVKPATYIGMLNVFLSLERYLTGAAELPSVQSFRKRAPIPRRNRKAPAAFRNAGITVHRKAALPFASR